MSSSINRTTAVRISFRRALVGIIWVLSASQALGGGTLYYSEDGNGNGLFVLNTTTGLATLAGAGITGVTSSTVGLAESADPNVLYGSTWTQINSINADGSGATLLGSASAEGLGFDLASGKLYGAINGDFFEISTVTGGVIATLAAPGSDVEGLASGNGGVYGIDIDSNLKFYNIAGDSWSLVGNTGLPAGINKGLAYDPALDLLYAISGQDALLYSINPANAASAIIGDTGRQNAAGGLAFVVPEPSSFVLAALGLIGLVVWRRRKG